MDETDKQILGMLQRSSDQPISEMAREVGLSVTPCWRRIRRLEDLGVIKKRVALLDPDKINVGLSVFVQVRADKSDARRSGRFCGEICKMPEVVEFYRVGGDADYLIRVVVRDMQAYDKFYRELISRLKIKDVRSCFALQELKFTTQLPLDDANKNLKSSSGTAR